MMKKFNLVVAVMVVLGLVLTACGPRATPEAPTEAPPTEAPTEAPPTEAPPEVPMVEVKLGALVPDTGPLSEFGGGFHKAGDLAVMQLEQAGISVNLVYADTETSAMPGVDAARNLVDVERAVALIGAASSGVTMPIAQSVSIPSEVPQISNASTNPLMTNLPADEGKDFLFRTCPSDALQGVVLGKLAADEGYETVSVLYVNNPYGEGLAEVFKETFEGLGGTVPAMVPHDEEPAATYVTELRQVMEDEPDAMVALAYPGQATVYLKEFFEAGYDETTDLLFVDGTKSTDMPAELGPDLLAGYLGTAPGTAGGQPLENFQADYEAEYGELPPLPFMSNFYDAVIVAALAAAKCEADGVEITPVNVRDRLRDVANPPGETILPGADSLSQAVQLLMDGQDINFEGAAGAVDFDENGDVVTPIEVWKYVAEEPYIETVRMEEVGAAPEEEEAVEIEPVEVKLGALVPDTGPLSEFGGGFHKAGDLAVMQLTEAGVIVNLVYADTETSAMPGVDAARNLVDVERVAALIGAASSGVTMPIAQSVSIPSEVPQISNASTNPLMTNLPADEGKDFLFRTCPSDALQGVVLGKLAADQGYETVSVLYVNNPYGEGLAEVFKATFEGLGGMVPAMVPHDEQPAATYVTELRQVMEDEPDAMVALAYPGQATVYLKEFFEAGYDETTDLLFVDGTKSTEMPAELGPDLLAGYFGTAPGTAGGQPLENFQADYEAEYGELPPLPFMSNFYDAVIVAALAAAKCEADGVEITPVNVRDRLRDVANPPGETVLPGVDSLSQAVQLLMNGQDINFEGAAGAVDFDENGDVVTPIEVWKYVAEEPYIETVRMEEVE